MPCNSSSWFKRNKCSSSVCAGLAVSFPSCQLIYPPECCPVLQLTLNLFRLHIKYIMLNILLLNNVLSTFVALLLLFLLKRYSFYIPILSSTFHQHNIPGSISLSSLCSFAGCKVYFETFSQLNKTQYTIQNIFSISARSMGASFSSIKQNTKCSQFYVFVLREQVLAPYK